MQDIHKLSLILMQSLNLYIKDRIRIDFDTIVLLDIFCQTDLILLFDLQKFLLCFRIGCIFCQILDLRKTCDPVFSDMLCYPVCKQWISMCKETSLCDTVGFIVKFLRKQFIEITKFLLLKNLCMQSCHTVDRISGNNCKICHLHLSVVENCHLAHLLLIIRIFCTDLFYKTAVDLIHDLIYTRKQSLEDVDRPLFKCLCHDGMVGISYTVCCDLPCLIP